MAYLTPSPKMQFFTANGIPLVGGKLYTYEAGTTTPLATYVDQAGSSSNPNPIILDSRGEANVWLGNAVLYDFVLKDSTDVLIWTGTNVGNAGSNPLASTFKVQNFSGDGTTVAFVLTYEPPNENNTQIYINGAYQQKNTYSLAASTITFSSAPPLGTDNIEVMTIATLSFGYIDSSLVNYIPAGTGAVSTVVQTKLYESVSVLDFGADPTGVTDSFTAMQNAWNYCYPLGKNLYFPAGIYDVRGERSYPFNQGSGVVTALLDCNNMTIFGDGPSTILRTTSVNGADVLQLNGLKNFHVRDLQVQSVVTGSASGSNAISVTGGFDNLTFDGVWMKDLGYVDKVTYIDGGKALSIQPPSEAHAITMGSLKATNIFADGCVYGFGYEPDNDLALVQPVSIDIDIVASNCRQGVIFSGGETSAAVSANSTSGIRIKAQTINCMQDVVVERSFGIDINAQIIQTKTAAQTLLSWKGTQWTSADTVANVIGLTCTYARNSSFKVTGNKLACASKANIGGASEALSGLGGATQYCDFYLDITGVSTITDMVGVDAGGNVMKNCRLYCTTSTSTTLPTNFYPITLNNLLTVGPSGAVQTLGITGSIGWTQTDGLTVYNNMFLQTGVLSTKQTGASGAGTIVQQWLDHTGNAKVGFRNDGAIATTTKIASTSVTTVNGALPFYDLSGTLLGYVPIYTTRA